MKGAAIIILFAAIVAAKPRDVAVNSAGCPNEDPEVFLPHENCDRFYQCVGGTAVEQSCPTFLVFNLEHNICDWPFKTNCEGRIVPEEWVLPDGAVENVVVHGYDDFTQAPAICAAEDSESILVAHEDCDKFYICHAGEPVALSCPNFLFYNPEKEQCDFVQHVNCGNRNTQVINLNVQRFFTCDTEEPFAHENCNRFNKCDHGFSVSFDCPAGLMYNIDTHECDWANEVDCGDRTIADLDEGKEVEEWKPEYGHSDPSQAPAICAAEGSDNVLIAHENCNQFYKCNSGAPVALDCPQFLYYNPEQGACDWLQNVDCGSRIH